MAEEKESRLKALNIAIDQIEKQFGKGSVMRLGEGPIAKIDAISTGSISLDAALGIGGVPRGRVVEIFGPEASGKTTLCLHIIGEAQKRGGMAAFIDAEHALDLNYAKRLGVDVNNLLLSQPEFGEQALEIVETLVRSGALDVIVIDSVAALTPRAEIEGEMGDPQMGIQARLMSQALRKLTSAISKSNTCVIFTNQLRQKIGIMFGNPETTTGGNALKFYASVRIDVRRIEAIKDGQNIIGNRTRARIVKNKVAPPFKEAEFDILYNEGISRLGDILDTAVNLNIIQKSGSWFSYKEDRIGQGRDAVKKYLQDNPELASAIEAEIREKLGIPGNHEPQKAESPKDEPARAVSTTRGSSSTREKQARS
ncbi:MAG: recombinase RecA [Bacteroidota bacterium]